MFCGRFDSPLVSARCSVLWTKVPAATGSWRAADLRGVPTSPPPLYPKTLVVWNLRILKRVTIPDIQFSTWTCKAGPRCGPFHWLNIGYVLFGLQNSEPGQSVGVYGRCVRQAADVHDYRARWCQSYSVCQELTIVSVSQHEPGDLDMSRPLECGLIGLQPFQILRPNIDEWRWLELGWRTPLSEVIWWAWAKLWNIRKVNISLPVNDVVSLNKPLEHTKGEAINVRSGVISLSLAIESTIVEPITARSDVISLS